MMVLKNTVKECREEKHISQDQLADITGVARETISRLENGKYQSPKYRLIYDIAAYFGKPIEDVFYYAEEKKIQH